MQLRVYVKPKLPALPLMESALIVGICGNVNSLAMLYM